jgi:hypothetical protein
MDNPLSTSLWSHLGVSAGQWAMELLCRLGDSVRTNVISRATSIARTLQELSVGLCRGMLFMHRASVGMLARISGTGFWAVMDVPTDEPVV